MGFAETITKRDGRARSMIFEDDGTPGGGDYDGVQELDGQDSDC